MADPYAISPYGVNFLKQQEGYVGTPVWDYKQYSSGYGTRANYPGERIDPNEAERRLVGETNHVSDWLRNNVKVPLSQNQTDALISAGYNLGTGPKGLGRLLGDINGQNWDSIAARLPTFNKAGGKVNPGLVNRRAAEVKLLTGKGEMDTNTNPMLIASAIRNSKAIGAPVEATGSVPVGDGMDRLKAALAQTYDPQKIDRYGSTVESAQKIAGSSGNPIGAIGGTLLAALGGYMKGGEEDKKKAYNENQRQGLAQAADTAAVAKLLMASPDPAQQEQGIMLLAKNEAAKRANPEVYGTTPQYYPDPNTGELQFGVVSNRGNFKPVATPGGKVLPPTYSVDRGTSTDVITRAGGVPLSSVPKDIAGKERQQEVGKGQGQAQVDLPRVESNSDSILSMIEAVRSDPYLPRMTGPVDTWLPNLSGDAARVQSKVDQLGNQAFLQAFQAIKGAGAITDAEGAKATSALSRLQSLGVNDADYPKALDDFRNEVIRLRDLAKQRAGSSGETSAPAVKTEDPLGIR
jgi:GH24 family phage-related lysozyme (muramidase)